MTINIDQHRTILIRILKDIYENPDIGPDLGFKGGTAALLFYELPRFSVDLDFDLLDENKKNYIFEQIENILKTYGLVKKADKKRYSLFYLLSYDAKIKDAQNIKVEINIRNFGSKYENKRYLGINLKVMIQEDMVANKLVAMYERMGKANRDIFDVWYFLHKNWPVNKKIVESRTTLSYKQFLQKCISELENLDNKSMLSGLGELLNTKQKAWVKEKLKNETIFLLKLALANE